MSDPSGGGRLSPTVADAVGRRLAALGVDTFFGVVGSGNFVVTAALSGAGARFVAARHESGAVCMADGWARVTGRVGVCSLHQGPGLTNAVTGIAEAVKSRTPLLVLAGDTPPAALASNFLIDQDGLVTSVGAIAETIYSAETAEADAVRALRRARLERRPVILNLPIDVQAQPAAGVPDVAAAPLPGAPGPRPADVAAAADLLEQAQRPLIIAGRGAVISDAGPALAALGERCGALLANSAPAHGIFAGEPFGLGIAGGFSTPLAAGLLPQADVVISFGAGLNHWTTRHGELIGAQARLIGVDVDPGAIGKNRRADLAVAADASAMAEALDAELARRGVSPAPWRTEELRDELAARRWRDEPFEPSDAGGVIDPRTLSIALADLLPADKAVVIDSGHFTGWPAMFLDVEDPRAWLFVNGFQCVGLGLGCAIGAAVAAPERMTVLAVGDGGLFLSLPELDTAARVGARLLVVVYDDAAYGAELHHFGPMGHDTDTVRFRDADLAAIAAAAGCGAVTVRSLDDLAPVEAWARDGGGPLLVDAKVDPAIVADWLKDAFRAG
ncbi:thiamine pyrophosphate-binding protein [Capillimicrobium parvum]|nr:thiamine pyrophosphate-binding protein [Capillimicrobium parvum]